MLPVWLGAGDTLIPGIMNLASLRGVRIVLTIFLVPRFGLYGAWIAMDIELCFRGMIFFNTPYADEMGKNSVRGIKPGRRCSAYASESYRINNRRNSPPRSILFLSIAKTVYLPVRAAKTKYC